MAAQVANGKANEWALSAALSSLLNIPIRPDSAAAKAKLYFDSLGQNQQSHFTQAARRSAKFLTEMEAQKLAEIPPRQIIISSDFAGTSGDVRDVVLNSGFDVLGISCKTNHDAYKHPRISGSLDWVRKWGLDAKGCSNRYWADIQPIFAMLENERLASGGTTNFRDIPKLHYTVLRPVVEAFKMELERLVAEQDPVDLAESFTRYVVGEQDFYKVVTAEREISITGFNFNGSLACQRNTFPSEITNLVIDEQSDTTLRVTLDEDYVFDFRIHTASSKVEPSLKFDVQAVQLPVDSFYLKKLEI